MRLYVKELVLKNFAGLPSDQLLADGGKGVINAEVAGVARHLGVEDGLQHEVAQFLGQPGPIAIVDRFQHLVGFFDGVRLDGIKRLFAVPRATSRSSQFGHDLDELLKALTGCG